ncbi:unnamed protein product [Nezara viridula]|uniref:Black n=1 Tax=Nezara viridula TaxID=85310 RepID=A0A9P0MLF7_NEZVI|nr:unnamed protein product [Nezara viridula]
MPASEISSFAASGPADTSVRFLTRVQQIVLEHAEQAERRDSKVSRWVDPERLQKILDLQFNDQPASMEQLMDCISDTLRYSVNIAHPYFLNQLYSTVDRVGLAGQWVTDTLNASVYTYEVAPVFTLMEEMVLAKMRQIVGWSSGDGIFSPGGSIANGYAINLARFHKFPQVKSKGLYGLPRLVMFTSEEAHYSIVKMAGLEGIGIDNVYQVRTDSTGRMDVGHLKQEIQRAKSEGGVPFMVSATAGTTVLGAFDPLEDIADICNEEKLWFHVDAAWGGGALMSTRRRHLLSGIDRADSVTWNPHKMLAAPQQCSTFLTKHPKILQECHSASASYLFQKDKFYDTSYDIGDKHLQCGRRVDVFKFWLMWKSKGTAGLEEHVDRLFDMAEYFTDKIRQRPGFRLVIEKPQCTNISFWYVPPSLRDLEGQPDFKEKLNKVAPLMKERMMREGTMMITYQPLKDHPNFFRLVLQNSSLTREDMDHIVQEIERLGRGL